MCTWMNIVVARVLVLALLGGTPSVISSSNQPSRRTPIVEVFERARDSVVNITATQIVEIERRVSPLENFFDLPGFGPQKQRYERTSLGSGFILHADGYVVTNAHVVAQAARPKVIFADRSEHEADLVSIDERHDLAVLKIDARRALRAIVMGRSDDLMIGETVIAIGNPLGYEHTVTAGIVSALNRKLTIGEDVLSEHLIQTDASINRGNSGGPLLSILGELIGINTAIRGDAQNIGFAIPVDDLRKLLPDMLSIERRKRLETGLRLSSRGRPKVIEAVGPAAAAGIEPGDELTAVDGKPITSDVDFHVHMLSVSRNNKVDIKLTRGNKSMSATLVPKAIPIPDGAELLQHKFGLTVRILTPKEAKQLDVDGRLLITRVERDSPAGRAGFVPGLIIFQIGNDFPSDLEDVGLLLEQVRPGEKLLFKVYEVQQMFLRVLAGALIAR